MSDKRITTREGGGPVRRHPEYVGMHGAEKLANNEADLLKAFPRRARDYCVCPTCGDTHLNAKTRERMKRLVERRQRRPGGKA